MRPKGRCRCVVMMGVGELGRRLGCCRRWHYREVIRRVHAKGLLESANICGCAVMLRRRTVLSLISMPNSLIIKKKKKKGAKVT